MIGPRAGKVKPAVRQITFQFRADPVALDGMRLTRTARALFGLILDNAKSKGWRSRLSNTTFARVLDCTRMTVCRCLAQLEAAGLIRRDFVAGGRVRTGIVVTWEGVQHSAPPAPSKGATSAQNGAQHSRITDQSPCLSAKENQRGASAPGIGPAPGEGWESRILTPAEFAAAWQHVKRGASVEDVARLLGHAGADEAPQPKTAEAPEGRQDATPAAPVRSDVRRPERPATPRVARLATADASAPVSPLASTLRSRDDRRPIQPRPLPCPAPETRNARPPAKGSGRHYPHDRPGSPGRGPELLH